MINIYEVLETNKMIEQENLDVRTITMGINLLDCVDSDVDALCRKIYDKITRLAKDLVKTGEDISKEYGIPIVNKRVFVGGRICLPHAGRLCKGGSCFRPGSERSRY